MVLDPVKRGNAEDGVNWGGERQWLGKICVNHLYPIQVSGDSGPETVEHPGGAVQGDYSSTGQSLQQPGCVPAGSAASLENRFVSVQIEEGQDPQAPGILRFRQGFVGLGVPLPGGQACSGAPRRPDGGP